MFRFAYSKEFLRWALQVGGRVLGVAARTCSPPAAAPPAATAHASPPGRAAPSRRRCATQPPGFKPVWHCGVRVGTTGKLVAFISGIPAAVRVNGAMLRTVEINFLCVHKKLRHKRLAPVLIKVRAGVSQGWPDGLCSTGRRRRRRHVAAPWAACGSCCGQPPGPPAASLHPVPPPPTPCDLRAGDHAARQPARHLAGEWAEAVVFSWWRRLRVPPERALSYPASGTPRRRCTQRACCFPSRWRSASTGTAPSTPRSSSALGSGAGQSLRMPCRGVGTTPRRHATRASGQAAIMEAQSMLPSCVSAHPAAAAWRHA